MLFCNCEDETAGPPFCSIEVLLPFTSPVKRRERQLLVPCRGLLCVCVVGALGPSLRVCYQYCRWSPWCASLPVCCNAWTLVAANRCLWGLTCGRYGTARLTTLAAMSTIPPYSSPPCWIAACFVPRYFTI